MGKHEGGELDHDDVQADLLAHRQQRIAALERRVRGLVMEEHRAQKTRRAVQRRASSSCVVSGPMASSSDEVANS